VALVAALVLAAGMFVLALGTAAFAVSKGLIASERSIAVQSDRAFDKGFSGRRNPLFRKELLWFARDRNAVVQAILIPLTMAAFQMFNLRTVATTALSHWPAFCALAIVCGTYFLMVLGPKSLLSEGGALWIALTWPKGLEDLLRAKARLWEGLANVVTLGILAIRCRAIPDAHSGDSARRARLGAFLAQHGHARSHARDGSERVGGGESTTGGKPLRREARRAHLRDRRWYPELAFRHRGCRLLAARRGGIMAEPPRASSLPV
jgi:hypothetical protein